MMSGKKTPRYLIQDYIENVATEKSIHQSRRRRSMTRTPDESESTQGQQSASKRKHGDIEQEELTPRHLIQGYIESHASSQPSTRKSRKIAELPPPSTNKVKKTRRRSSLGVPTIDKIANQFTPRTMITGFLQQDGLEETPDQKSVKGNTSSIRSSVGELPDNEITFQPVERSFHEKKVAKEAKKGKSSRQRGAIQIVRKRSERLAQGIDFSDGEQSDSTEDVETGRKADTSRKQHLISHDDIDDTSDKDTSSAEPSPRKTLARRSLSSVRKESIIPLQEADNTLGTSITRGISPSKSLVREGTLDVSTERDGTGSLSASKQLTLDHYRSSSQKLEQSSSEKIRDSLSRSSSRIQKSAHSVKMSVTEAISILSTDKGLMDNDSAQNSPTTNVSLDLHRSPRMSRSKLHERSHSKSQSEGDESGSGSGPENRSDRLSRSRRSEKSIERSKKTSQADLEENIEFENSTESGSKRKSQSRINVSSKQNVSRSSNVGNVESSDEDLQKDRTNSRSVSRSRSRIDKSAIDDVPQAEAEHESSLEVHPDDDIDQPRSGRSSPRQLSPTKNVYDFHDDSPSKRIIGKLSKTLQRSGVDDIIDAGELSREELDADSDNSGYEDDDLEELEESIIPSAGRGKLPYYTPLRTPHLKEKRSGKPVSMVTSTPKPPSFAEKQKSSKNKVAGKTRGKKADSGYLPTSTVKGLFTHFCPIKVSKDTIAEVEKVSALYWEQVAKDLESYALHAHRKTIEESDVELLMRRQKFITPKESLPALVEKYLPLELRQEIIPICRSGNKLELK